MRRRAATLSLLAASGALVAAALPATAAAPPPDGTQELAVSFRVTNDNATAVSCPDAPDGRTYTVSGHLVGPHGSLSSGEVGGDVAVYLHGLSFGEFFWRFQGAGGYNYSQNQAAAGQVSLVVDRLGYGRSGKPGGDSDCLGSQATVAHQLVSDLKSGSYSSGEARAPRFGEVALVGHSYGGEIAEVEAYTFRDISGLGVVGFSDVVQSSLLQRSAAYAAATCAAGGSPKRADYTSFGPPAGAPAALFNPAQTAPDVLAAAKPLLSIDPCGDDASFTDGVALDKARVASIDVPVLELAGSADKLFPPPAAAASAKLFTGAPSVTDETVVGSGHAYTLEKTHTTFERDIRTWLSREAFA